LTDAHIQAVADPPVFSVPAFCEAHGISRGYLYQLWSEGAGPRRMKVGRRTLISRDAAAAWRRRMEEETARSEGAHGARP
jgi:predicted DNA-binding transcriptional regulator AlpA